MHVIDGTELLAISCTFIPARLSDNHYQNTPQYLAQLMSLPEPLRSKLLHGDFSAGREDAASQVIRSDWIGEAQGRWKPDGANGMKMLTLGVDVAQGGADETVLAALYGTWFAPLIKCRGIDTANGPAVAGLAVQHVRDGALIVIDLTGGWGGSARDHLVGLGMRVEPVIFSQGSNARTKDGLFGFANKRSELWWGVREALDPATGDGIALPPDRRLAAQLAAPTWTLRGDKILIESKDDIRKRLGSSTDDADAVMLAWHQRADALRRQTRPRLNPGRHLGPLGWMGV
jgi:hypothetical protein